jgi:hypothetical protein
MRALWKLLVLGKHWCEALECGFGHYEDLCVRSGEVKAFVQVPPREVVNLRKRYEGLVECFDRCGCA